MSIADFILNGWGWACVFCAFMFYGMYANYKWLKLTHKAWEIADKWREVAVDRGEKLQRIDDEKR